MGKDATVHQNKCNSELLSKQSILRGIYLILPMHKWWLNDKHIGINEMRDQSKPCLNV